MKTLHKYRISSEFAAQCIAEHCVRRLSACQTVLGGLSLENSIIAANVDFFTGLFEMYTFYLFFQTVLKPKSYRKIWFALAFGISLVLEWILSACFPFFPLTMALMAAFLLVIAFLLFNGRWHMKILAAMCMVVLGAFVEMVVVLMLGFCMRKRIPAVLNNPVYALQARIFSALFTFVIVVIIVWFKRSDGRKIPLNIGMIFMSMPVFSGMILNQLFLAYAHGGRLTISLIFSVLGLLYINIAFYALSEALIRQSEVNLRYSLAQQQLDIQIRHYESLVENRKMILAMAHDAKKHLSALSSLADEGDLQAVNGYLQTLRKDTVDVLKTVDTGHPVIDAVLDEKKSIAEKAGIGMKIYVVLPEKLAIDNVDLCIILGNALDNATEACRKLPDGDEREISVKLMVSGNYFVAVIANTFLEADGSASHAFETSKENRLLHGYGLRNIERAVEKYAGHMQIMRENNRFILNIVMQINPAE